ncbi:phytanoyl-CoA dioxygenase family protein [Pedobacter heparinus]|uniref:Phytanoyl-CoA dioxygenase n=1 Tax=Pedobacter heparinus (strain ATCC 13125 / DSM 2366 / CIP 104194 / JCM 7457 / NBRC 12017 / NCIMB 9290 / NRRL B-14731 / HIM 762-3) TaxID=485917 RepID=C6XVB9_PEDHD|nr:phytanoyl-CoA dioxygenase family protein [Pedobacter heparinus]ACU03985.1 Phytanoyl-CoA dioxygenase [Pedobacter heparinus DSM 2366]
MFETDGFILLENFLEEWEIPILKQAVANVVAEKRVSSCIRPNNTLTTLRWNDPIVSHLLSSASRITAISQATKTKDLKWISGYISSKEPRSEALWWHQDWWCWQHPISFKKEAPQIAVLCYLSPVNKENGALRVLPGSHHTYTELHASLPEAHAGIGHFDPDNLSLKDYCGQFTLELKAGDAVVIDYRLLHGTHPNLSSERRDCVMITFTPDWKSLPEEIQGHLSRNYSLPFYDEMRVALNYPVDLLPEYKLTARDLEVIRVPPQDFKLIDESIT